MSNIAMIGDLDSIFGFKGLGVRTFPVQSLSETKEVIKNIIDKDFKIIFITENYSEGILEYAKEIHNNLWPLLVLIPSIYGSFGRGKDRLRNYIIKATGSDLLGK
ncbi:MAG: V-type ATP synthase subunit F [Candidatus Firestonebacteria bacterium]|nr:V-type ATP synthase subunit F [Candidatus Firestonebacteria bacterium]